IRDFHVTGVQTCALPILVSLLRLMSDYVFDADTAVTSGDDGVFSATLHDRWTIEKVPNGGYTMAVMLRACQQMSRHPDPLTATADRKSTRLNSSHVKISY